MEPLAAVLDPADALGRKNRLIDRAHKNALRRTMGRITHNRVLDYGCGNGRLTRWLADRGAIVHGVDTSPRMLAAARKNASDLRFSQIEDARIPSDGDVFDWAVSVYVLQHIAPDYEALEQTLREIARALKPGGRLAAIEQVWGQPSDQGAALPGYISALEAAGFESVKTTAVRAGDSRWVGLAQRRRLGRLPLETWLMSGEARRQLSASLAPGQYVDLLFRANKARTGSLG